MSIKIPSSRRRVNRIFKSASRRAFLEEPRRENLDLDGKTFTATDTLSKSERPRTAKGHCAAMADGEFSVPAENFPLPPCFTHLLLLVPPLRDRNSRQHHTIKTTEIIHIKKTVARIPIMKGGGGRKWLRDLLTFNFLRHKTFQRRTRLLNSSLNLPD